jgi:prepilin peptidase CpaA
LLTLAAWQDLRSHRIPNLLTGSGVVFGIACQAFFLGAGGMVSSIGGMLTGFAVFIPFYLLRAMGAGDVKLMAMVGAWLGPVGVLGAALGTFFAGGVMAMIYAAKSGALLRLLLNVRQLGYELLTRLAPSDRGAPYGVPGSLGKLPYAVAIAFGTLGFLVWKGGF